HEYRDIARVCDNPLQRISAPRRAGVACNSRALGTVIESSGSSMQTISEQLVLDLDDASVEAWALLAEQELADIATAESAEVIIVESRDPEARASYVREVEERAAERGWVTARLSLRDQSLTELDVLVREIAERMSPRLDTKHRGLPWLLESFAEEHRSAAQK